MRKCGTVVGVLAFIALSLSLVLAARGQETEGVASNGKHQGISDREKAGLRGAARSVEEERIYPPVTFSDGGVDQELKSWSKTEYDREGRIAAKWGRDSSREHGLGRALYVTRYTYNATGQLVRMARERDGEPNGETIYRYDDRGRLESISNSQDPGNPIAFHYDADGRKSKIAVAKPIDLPSGQTETAVSYSSEYFFDTGSDAPSLPGGGSTVTLYDDHDRPTEVQVRNSNGEIAYRTVRTYDDQGHVLEQKQTMDDVLRMIPPALQQEMMAKNGISAQEFRDQVAGELREQIAQLMGGSETSSTKSTFDAHGRETLRIQKAMGQIEERIESTYNEHGDLAKQSYQTTSKITPDDADRRETSSSERVFSYEYDSYGNWIVKKCSSRELPDGKSKDTGEVERRTIEYY